MAIISGYMCVCEYQESEINILRKINTQINTCVCVCPHVCAYAYKKI